MRLIKHHSVSPDMYMDFVEITYHHDFEQEIKGIREKWDITDTDWNKEYYTEDGWICLLENNELEKDVVNILKKLEIDLRFLSWVQKYAVLGWQWGPEDIHYDDTGIKTIKSVDGSITVEVGPNSTKEDYIKAWDNEIKKYLTPSKRKPRSKFWRDLQIFNLANEGKTLTEICALTNERFGEDLDYGNIKKIYSDMCQRLKVPANRRNELKTK